MSSLDSRRQSGRTPGAGRSGTSGRSRAAGQPATTAPSPGRRRRTIAITGSASGIGLAVRDRFERTGARTVGVDLHDADVVADLSTRAGRDAAVAAVVDLAGGRLDGVVACAGLGPHVQPVENIVRVNYYGALSFLDGLLPILGGGDAPAAVVMASNGATLTPPHAQLVDIVLSGDEEGAATLASSLDGATVYGMSKLALTRAVRRRTATWAAAGVRLNAVAPGPVDTPLLAGSLADEVLGPLVESLPVPLGRRATAAEIAAAVAFLLDPANGFIHGSVLFVDGGSDALLRPDAI